MKKNPCKAVALNVDKQDTNDFYMIKTYDDIGVLMHIKTQLNDIQGFTYVYDYDISYGNYKAIFNGLTKMIGWEPTDTFPDGSPNTNPDAPVKPVELINEREVRSFEVLFNQKTGFAEEVRFVDDQMSLLKLTYNKNKFLEHLTAYGYDGISYDWQHEPTSVTIHDFNVETDKEGNILSIIRSVNYEISDPRGVRYAYSDKKSNNHQFYETPTIFIHPMYSILELLNWGPFQPKKERIGYSIQWAIDPQDELFSPSFGALYSNHLYDNNNNLIGYDFDGSFTRSMGGFGGYPYHRTRSINWNCTETPGKKFTP